MAASGKKNMFNEATRVQMPAMVHLTRLGYTYFGKITEDMAGTVYDPDTNILINVFKEQFARLNPTYAGEAEQTLKTIRQELDNDDIGRSFYERLSSVSPVRLVDFENPKNNTYHFTAEFTCKRDQDEFRPDITLFVNGLPLVFVEVKKPNNHGGMVAESKRMNQKRFPNKKFRRFLNITQLMIFSNNMEYDTMGGIVPVQGAFYCTTAKQSAPFNCFREENPTNLDIAPYNADFPYKDIDPIVEKKILTDFNCQVIHTSPEYQTNLDNLMGYEEEYNQSFEDNKIHINFVDSKENELVQLADNISSIYRKCFEKSFEAFRCNKQWTDNIWFTENYSRIINTIGMEHIKMDTQISDYVLPFVIRDIFGNEYGQFEKHKEKFWGLFYFYKEKIMEDIDRMNVELPL